MHEFFNRVSTKERRRALRNNATQAEREMWYGLRKRRTEGFKFRWQHGIGPFIADFYSPALKLVVEIDGITHEDPDQKLYDARRTQYFQEHGIDEIRFTDAEVLWSVDTCIVRIVKFIEERSKEKA